MGIPISQIRVFCNYLHNIRNRGVSPNLFWQYYVKPQLFNFNSFMDQIIKDAIGTILLEICRRNYFTIGYVDFEFPFIKYFCTIQKFYLPRVELYK